jgi:hypothetical protein
VAEGSSVDIPTGVDVQVSGMERNVAVREGTTNADGMVGGGNGLREE